MSPGDYKSCHHIWLSLTVFYIIIIIILILFVCIETVSLYAASVVLGLTMWTTRLALNSESSTCLCEPSAGIKEVHPYTWLVLVVLR